MLGVVLLLPACVSTTQRPNFTAVACGPATEEAGLARPAREHWQLILAPVVFIRLLLCVPCVSCSVLTVCVMITFLLD